MRTHHYDRTLRGVRNLTLTQRLKVFYYIVIRWGASGMDSLKIVKWTLFNR